MEIITPVPATATTTAKNATAKSPEPDVETPTRIHQNPNLNPKPVSFSNGVLKRHHANHRPNAVVYKECLKNHVASLGGHALDGCGEFMPSPAATADDPSSIKCAACGCHRNFHRREPEETPISPATHHVLEYQPHHRHHPPPPAPSYRSPNSASPPPISSYPSAPHMLLALSGGGGFSVARENTGAPAPAHNHSRKRFRTKFTQEQKEKMHEFADKVGWKMQKRDDEMVMEFCNEIGVERGVLKVWMHNNKNTLAKKDNLNNGNGSTLSVSANGISLDGAVGSATVRTGVHVPEHGHEHSGINGNGSGDNNHNHNLASHDVNEYENDSGTNGGGTNGSSSSS